MVGPAILLGVAIGFCAGRMKKLPPPSRSPTPEVTISATPVVTGMLAQARELVALEQEIEQLRRERGWAVPGAAAHAAATESAPDAGAPPPRGSVPLTRETLEADQRAADLVTHAETSRSWTARDRVEMRQLMRQMDRAARHETLSRLARGINAQQIKPEGPPLP